MPGIVVVGQVEHLTVQSKLPASECPILLSAYVEALVVTLPNRMVFARNRKSGPKQPLPTKVHGGAKPVTGKNVHRVALVVQGREVERILNVKITLAGVSQGVPDPTGQSICGSALGGGLASPGVMR